MKTPDEIKKALECCANDKCEECPYDASKCVCFEKDALEYIQQLEAKAELVEQYRWERDVAIDQLEQLGIGFGEKVNGKLPRRISVEEQPEPPKDDVYWCYGYWIGSGRKQAETAEYLCGEWKIVNNFVLTHWMPLPEPPKEE